MTERPPTTCTRITSAPDSRHNDKVDITPSPDPGGIIIRATDGAPGGGDGRAYVDAAHVPVTALGVLLASRTVPMPTVRHDADTFTVLTADGRMFMVARYDDSPSNDLAMAACYLLLAQTLAAGPPAAKPVNEAHRSHPRCWGPAGHVCQEPSGRECIEAGCDLPAGTGWGPHWCPDHDVERLDRISDSLDAISATLHTEPDPEACASLGAGR